MFPMRPERGEVGVDRGAKTTPGGRAPAGRLQR
jgi:hypothetical protein